jgi:hypothetical protein
MASVPSAERGEIDGTQLPLLERMHAAFLEAPPLLRADEGRRGARRSGVGGFAQDRVERILEVQLFFLEMFDRHAVGGNDAGFHILDLLIQFVMAIE